MSEEPGTNALLDDLARLAARTCGGTAAAVDVRDGEQWRTLLGPARADGPVLARSAWPGTGTVPAGELRVLGDGEVGKDAALALDVLARSVASCLELDAALASEFDAREEAARAAEQLVQVAGQLAHDLNNPLAAMAMSLEIAADQVDESQPLLASLLDRAQGSATRMKRMTADLLSYAQQPSPGTTDLQAEVDAALVDFGGLLPGRVSVPSRLPVVVGSPGDLRVVLVALLENAVKFADAGTEPEVTVTAEDLGGRWRIVVADNGRGVAEEDGERIFEPTVRLDKRVPGLGLGLATTRRIVAAYGGEVGARPRPGGGTEVWFVLPAADEPGDVG